MRALILPMLCLISFALFFLTCQTRTDLNTYHAVLKFFQNPPVEFRTVPFWVWNDAITKEQIETQLADFKAHGIGGLFIHPRPGLITPYLSEQWLDLCRYAVETAKELGLKIWLYDENSYPSGFAGGNVPAQMPDAIGKGLRMIRTSELPATFEQPPLVILRQTASGFEDITQKVTEKIPAPDDQLASESKPDPNSSRPTRHAPRSTPPGDYFIFELKENEPSPWFGGYTYVDLMRRDVTEKFLDVTLNAYQKVIGKEFGRAVLGVFQDEAHISPFYNEDVINYTPALFDKFQARWGYDLKPQLPSLLLEIGDWQRVRHNYYATLLDLFIENWAKPYNDYCNENNLIFTGHYWEHEWPMPRLSPDNMAMAAYAGMPGIDILMNDFQTDPHAQFGNARAVKEIRSIANQLGKPRTLSETYGAGGWDMTFFDQKRIGDWEYALGVNFLNQHLSYVTIKGARKRDHPPSFSYHEPWWHSYSMLADYFSRLSVALSLGKQENRIVVIEPTTTAWMYYSPAALSEHFKRIGTDFQDFVNRLEAAQIEYDLASEAILADYGKAGARQLIVGSCRYDLVILPPGLENLSQATVNLLERYLMSGGKILSLTHAAQFVDGKIADVWQKLQTQFADNWIIQTPDNGLKAIFRLVPPVLEFKAIQGDRDRLFHHRRMLQDAELIFLANISDSSEVAGKFAIAGGNVEKWDPFTGSVEDYDYEQADGKLLIDFALRPGASLLLCVRPDVKTKPDRPNYTTKFLPAESNAIITRQSPNVLTLDYCDLLLDGKLTPDRYFYEAQQKIFQHHGLSRNPWDGAVQFQSNILDQNKFPAESGFEAYFWFTAENGVNLSSLQAVIEQPELYSVFINDQKVEPIRDNWWLDRAFGVFDVGSFAISDKNKITLKAAPFTVYIELESIYLLGDFRLEEDVKGFRLIKSCDLSLGAWSQQGLPFYAHGVSYQKVYSIGENGLENARYLVQLGNWLGSMAEVKVNGRRAGFIAFQPFELDISDQLQPGKNTVEVIVYGTLKNLLGPHHKDPPPGRAWPWAFQQSAKEGVAPGSEYNVVSYGLMEDFQVKVLTYSPIK